MCPLCMATTLWIAAGAVSTGGIYTVAVTKLWNKRAQERAKEKGNDNG